MIFDLLTRPQGPRGGAKISVVARTIYMSSLYTNYGWISFNGLDADSIIDRWVDGWIDRWTGAITISPLLFFKKKKRWYKD